MKKLLLLLCLFGMSAYSIHAQEIPDQLLHKEQLLLDGNIEPTHVKFKSISNELELEELRFAARGLFATLKSSYGTQFDLMADQITTTNNVRNFWQLAEEPKEPINNEPDSRYFGPEELFDALIGDQRDLNNLIIQMEDSSKTFVHQARDLTEAMRANLYFLRGLSKTYFALIYDRGTVIQDYYEGWVPIPNPENREKIFESGIFDLENAILIAESLQDSDYEWLLLDSDYEINRENFLKMVHSFAAKMLISFPTISTDYNPTRVLQHAEAGLDEDFPHVIFHTANDGVYLVDNYSDWSNFLITCSGDIETCAGYLPTDVKVMHLLNPQYPTIYPMEDALGSLATFAPNTSDDPRLAYFQYTTNAGYLNSARNPELYSNYFSKRQYAVNDWWAEGNPVILLSSAELQYIKAEAYATTGNIAAANVALQESPYGTVAADFSPDLPSVQAGYMDADGYAFNGPAINSYDELIQALHKEYSVEIGTLTSIGTLWFFMRRHGLLQELSAELWPIPYERWDGFIDEYTFGGLSAGSGHENSWHISERLPAPEGLKANIESSKVILEWDQYRYRIPLTSLTLSYDGLNINLSTTETEFVADGLDNNTWYSFTLIASTESAGGSSSSVSATPNIFGAPTFIALETEDGNDALALRYETVTGTVQLTNYESSEIHVSGLDAFQVNEDSTVYEQYLDFFSVSEESFTIQPGETKEVEISFNSTLWGSMPDIIFDFINTTEEFALQVSPPYIDPKEYRSSNWNYFFNAPDSISFGELGINEKDSSYISLQNLNVRSMMIDTLYIEAVDEDGSRYPSPIFSFSDHSPDSIILKPLDTFTTWLYANPTTPQAHEAFGYWGGNLWGSSSIGRFTVNNGERMTTNTGLDGLPQQITLSQNYPNPFNPSTNIQFTLPQAANVTLHVFNLLGQRVQSLVSDRMTAGTHTVQFDGRQLSSGVYFYRIEAGNFVQTKRMLLIK